MDGALVFSTLRKIYSCNFVTDTIVVLVSDKGFDFFDLLQADYLFYCVLDVFWGSLMPVSVFVHKESKRIVLQGKMGENAVVKYDLERKKAEVVKRYKTHAHGFCKMAEINANFLMHISDQQKSIHLYDMWSGNLKYNKKIDQQFFKQSICCIQISQNSKSEQKLKAYLGWQGNLIQTYQIDLTKNQEDDMIQPLSQLTLQTNKEVKIIVSLKQIQKKVYCIFRSVPNLYIIETQPKLTLKSVINLSLKMPKSLQFSSKKHLIILADGNRVKFAKLQNFQINIIAQIKQSKYIQQLYYGNQGICGFTNECQFFYLEL